MVTSNITNVIGGTTSSDTQPKYVDPKERGSLSRDDFMKLFLTQLQFQDPTKPMESAEMATQMAQFNMVDLLQKNNDAMSKLVSADQERNNLSALSYIGHEVRYKGNLLNLKGGHYRQFQVDLNADAADSVAVIKDSTGRAVRTLDMGALTKGMHDLNWDGLTDAGEQAPDGVYSVSIKAVNENKENVNVTTWTTGTVANLVYAKDGLPTLGLQEGPKLALSDVDSIW
jgi:flagellar basal-body rod modification protein FlgD